jgi:Cysteine rich repeat
MIHKRPFITSMMAACTLVVQAAMVNADERPCRADIEKFCADVSRGGGRVAECLRQHYEDLSPECKARGQELREHVREAHAACKEDISKYCKEIQPGKGRILTCLKEHDANLSADCRDAIKPAR